jgi:hypothetical protein
VIVVAAAGSQKRRWLADHAPPVVIPVTACETQGRPLGCSNLGHSIGRRGLSLSVWHRWARSTEQGRLLRWNGVAAPFVTGTVASLVCVSPANAAQIKLAIMQVHAQGRRSVVPPLLDAWATYRAVVSIFREGS